MSSLYAFLHPVSSVEEKEIEISTRFVDENGLPVPFRIRSMTQEEMDSLVKKSTKTETIKGAQSEHFDALEFNRRLIVASTVEPNFAEKDLCDAYGVVSPLLVPVKMLLPGEYKKLLAAISELNGITDQEDGKVGEENSAEKN